jgi:FkbM family methyltransferase
MIPHFRTRLKLAALTVAGRNPLGPLNQIVREYARYLSVDIACRRIAENCRKLKNDPIGINLWATPGGELWAPESTDRTGIAVMLAEQELGAYGNGSVQCRAGDIVLDCGANIGLFSRMAVAAAAKRVIAVEPFRLSAECLRRNLAKEIAAGQVVVYEKGLWDEESHLPFIIDPHNAGGNSFITVNKDAYEGQAIAVTTIDRLIGDLNLERVDFIKMDIEAAEQRALAGAANTLKTFRPRMVIAVEHTPDRLGNARGVIQIVRRANTKYSFECGLCYVSPENHVLPELLYFH